MSATLVSVVLPTFNRAKQLARALDSVLAQTYGQFEVLVVDDGSTDETSGVIEGRYHDEPRVVYLRQEHAGVAQARNTALERARGDVIAFLDSDDEWRPWKLAFQLECLQRTPEAGMVWTDMDAVDAAGNLMPGCSLRDILSAFRSLFRTCSTSRLRSKTSRRPRRPCGREACTSGTCSGRW
jgi:glycosyltransferase involved in cell wall biosynthesis